MRPYVRDKSKISHMLSVHIFYEYIYTFVYGKDGKIESLKPTKKSEEGGGSGAFFLCTQYFERGEGASFFCVHNISRVGAGRGLSSVYSTQYFEGVCWRNLLGAALYMEGNIFCIFCMLK